VTDAEPLATVGFAPNAHTVFDLVLGGDQYFSLRAPDGRFVVVSDDRTLRLGPRMALPSTLFRWAKRPKNRLAMQWAGGGFVIIDAKGLLRATAPSPDPSGDFGVFCQSQVPSVADGGPPSGPSPNPMHPATPGGPAEPAPPPVIAPPPPAVSLPVAVPSTPRR
jgi:hypothetical protein